MVAPELVDEQRTEGTSALSPMKEKQLPLLSEHRHPWRKPLRELGGVIVSLIGGIAYVYITMIPGGFFFGGIVALFVGIVGAVLLRTRWAILIVPLALILGELLVVPQLFAFAFMSFGSFLLAFAGPMFAVLGSLGSISIVKEDQEQGFTTMPTDF